MWISFGPRYFPLASAIALTASSSFSNTRNPYLLWSSLFSLIPTYPIKRWPNSLKSSHKSFEHKSIGISEIINLCPFRKIAYSALSYNANANKETSALSTVRHIVLHATTAAFACSSDSKVKILNLFVISVPDSHWHFCISSFSIFVAGMLACYNICYRSYSVSLSGILASRTLKASPFLGFWVSYL